MRRLSAVASSLIFWDKNVRNNSNILMQIDLNHKVFDV